MIIDKNFGEQLLTNNPVSSPMSPTFFRKAVYCGKRMWLLWRNPKVLHSEFEILGWLPGLLPLKARR